MLTSITLNKKEAFITESLFFLLLIKESNLPLQKTRSKLGNGN